MRITASIGARVRSVLRAVRCGVRLAEDAAQRVLSEGIAGLARVRRHRLVQATGEGFAGHAARGATFDVIYAVGYTHGEPKRYRVFNAAEGLRARGYAVHVIRFDLLEDICRYGWTASVLVLFRAEDDPLVGIGRVLAYAHEHGMRVVYDIDDLIFDARLIDRMDAARTLPAREKARLRRAAESRLRLLRKADFVTVTTSPLARAVERYGVVAKILPNSLNTAQERLASDLRSRPYDTKRLRIGYFSGSATHQLDFQQCEDALLDVMDRFPEVVFRLVGYLKLGPRWDRHAHRVERFEFMPALDMLRCLADVDVNLAPLEVGNPFCEAKSELKFFEAAIVDIPTVASATQPMLMAIENGVSGFVAKSRDEWFSAIATLLSDRRLRKSMGEAARIRALSRHGLGPVTDMRANILGLETPRRDLGASAYIDKPEAFL